MALSDILKQARKIGSTVRGTLTGRIPTRVISTPSGNRPITAGQEFRSALRTLNPFRRQVSANQRPEPPGARNPLQLGSLDGLTGGSPGSSTSGSGGFGYGGVESPAMLGADNLFNPNQYDFDSLFNPVFAAFGQAEQAAREGSATALSEINTAEQKAKSLLDQQRESQSGLLNQAQRDAYRGEESALSRAGRAAQEMQQGLSARFGGRNSAGLAGSEILNQATQQTIGDISQQGLNAQDAIQGERRRLDTFVQSQLQNISSQVGDARKRVRDELNNRLVQINTARGQLEADKAAQRLNALQNYQNQLGQIDQYNNQLTNSAINFRNQLNAQLQAAQSSAGTGYDNRLKAFQILTPSVGQQAAAIMSGLVQGGSQEARAFPLGIPNSAYEKYKDITGQTGFISPSTGQGLSPQMIASTLGRFVGNAL